MWYIMVGSAELNAPVNIPSKIMQNKMQIKHDHIFMKKLFNTTNKS